MMRLGVFFYSQNLRKKDFFNDFNFAGAAREFLAPAKINQKIRLDKSIRASTCALRKIRASLRHNPKISFYFPRAAARISRGGSWISWEVWCKGWRRLSPRLGANPFTVPLFLTMRRAEQWETRKLSPIALP